MVKSLYTAAISVPCYGRRKSMPGKIMWGKLLGKLSPYTIKKGLLYLKHYGPSEFWVRLHERFEPEEIPYGEWFEQVRAGKETLDRQRRKPPAEKPLISIAVPLYHTPGVFLTQLLECMQAQTYDNWELCLANASPENEEMSRILLRFSGDDPRIRILNLPENLGIAGNTNAAMAMAGGEWIGLMDHDDLLEPDALYEAARAAGPRAAMIYTDEDKVESDLSGYFQPHLKPDFNLDLLRSNNYICHFLLFRRKLFELTGGMRESFDGAQDYDFIFRCAALALGWNREDGITDPFGRDVIIHIPRILYHWRTHHASTADNPASKMYAYEAGRRAIADHLLQTGTAGEVSHTRDFGFYRVTYPVRDMPLVSIIIPNKDHPELLSACLASLQKEGTYPNTEILIVENNSEGTEIFELYARLEKEENVRVLHYEGPFNYSAINNFAAGEARGSFLLFLNNDVTALESSWLEEMLGVCQRPEVGAAGAKLIYPDNRIQHAGIVVGMGGVAGSLFVDMPARQSGYLHKASLLQDLSAVTAACMMVRTEVFREAGGFTEALAVAFNDVDLCLKIGQKGYLVVYDPYACLCHAESRTRGAEDTTEKVRRFQNEIEYMRSHWLRILKEGDPCYNPNLSLTRWNYSLKPVE